MATENREQFKIRVMRAAGCVADEFNIAVLVEDKIVETFGDMNLTPCSPRYFKKVMKDSQFITVDVLPSVATLVASKFDK